MPTPTSRALLSIVDMRSISYSTSAAPPPRLRIDREIIESEQRSGGLVASDATLALDSHGLDGNCPEWRVRGTGRTLAAHLSSRRRTMSSRLPSTKPKD